MLIELTIRDFAIIDQLRIPFEPGLNALTGETGAGKSIIVDALGAVLGERVGSEVVRSGSKAARIEATFDLSCPSPNPLTIAALEELGIELDNGELILSREIGAGGRSAARINGRSATAGMLARVAARLVDIHGQSDHLSLLRSSEHLDVLDRFAGVTAARERCALLVHDLHGVRSRIDAIVGGARERAQRVDLLQYQVQEIGSAAPRPGEEDELVSERTRLANAERLATDAADAYALLAGSDIDDVGGRPSTAVAPALRKVSADLHTIALLDASATGLAERVDELLYLLEDIASETRGYRDGIEADPSRLEEVEERLDLLKRLKRKYGATIEEVIAFGEAAEAELASLTSDDGDVEHLRMRESELLQEIGAVVGALSDRRKEAADELSRAVEQAITELNMGRSRFAVSISHAENDRGVPLKSATGELRFVAFDETGADRVEFLLAPNAGESLKPLARVASGGEMARLMLALKSILSRADATPTLVFDEVDVGVGGRSGSVVGEKLWELARSHQVLVITHLPQIAAFAPTHFRIVKTEREGRIVSRVVQVTGDERVDELGAMLGGEPVSEASRANARELLHRADAWVALRRDEASVQPE